MTLIYLPQTIKVTISFPEVFPTGTGCSHEGLRVVDRLRIQQPGAAVAARRQQQRGQAAWLSRPTVGEEVHVT